MSGRSDVLANLVITECEATNSLLLSFVVENAPRFSRRRVVWTPGTQVTASMNMKAVCDWDGQPVKPRMIVMPEWRGMGTGEREKRASLLRNERLKSAKWPQDIMATSTTKLNHPIEMQFTTL